MSIRVIHGDCRSVLRELPDASVQCCVTSPPYWGLRDYGVAGQIGLEQTPDAYVAEMVAVFREVRRALRNDGVLFLNLGDSYNGGGIGGGQRGASLVGSSNRDIQGDGRKTIKIASLKPKDLIGIPWLVAFALRADGWWLRSAIVWHKPNPMPESTKDRPTSAYEHVFLLTKSAKYYFDNMAIAEKNSDAAAMAERYNSRHEDMHQMPRGKVGRRVPKREEGQGRDFFPVPHMPSGNNLGLAADAEGRGFIAGGVCTSQRKARTQGENGGDEKNAKEQGDERSVEEVARRGGLRAGLSEVGQAQGCVEAPLRERQGQGVNRPLPLYGEGQGLFGAGRPQATRADADRKHANCGRMVGDQDEGEAPLPLLPEADGAVDDGSCDSNQQRRASHSVEHRACVQAVQQPEREPLAAAGLRNVRNVWTIASHPFTGSHFATMPPELAERCVKAGSKPGDTILDPFAGASTTLLVASRLGRNAIGIELNPEYADMGRDRVTNDAPLFAEVTA